MLDKDSIIEILRSKKAILESMGIEKIGLIGSYATGMEHELSDIDLVIRFVINFKSPEYFFKVKFYLEQLFDKKIDLISLDEEMLDVMREHITDAAIYL